MDAAQKRRITIGVKSILGTADLDVKTTRHVIADLVRAKRMPDTPEARAYTRSVVRRVLPVFLTLREKTAEKMAVRVLMTPSSNGSVRVEIAIAAGCIL